MAGRLPLGFRRRTINMIPNTSRPISTMLEINSRNAPDNPNADSSEAIPRPAAIPTNGPSQRDMPLREPAVLALRLAARLCEDARFAAAGGFTAWRCLRILEDWRPKLNPPPKRLASASNETDNMASVAKAMSKGPKNLDKRIDIKNLL